MKKISLKGYTCLNGKYDNAFPIDLDNYERRYIHIKIASLMDRVRYEPLLADLKATRAELADLRKQLKKLLAPHGRERERWTN